MTRHHFMELLNNFRFVKAKPLNDDKAQLISEIKEAVENLKLVKEGKLKPKSVRALLDEL